MIIPGSRYTFQNLILGCVIFGLSSMASNLKAAPSTVSLEYRGFNMDASEAPNVPELSQLETALDHQIDIVLSVGLPDKMLNFFRTVPIKIIPNNSNMQLEKGFYSGSHKCVEFSTSLLSVKYKPVLLHEFLHAYHDQVIPRGFLNQTIIMYYKQARQLKAYNLRSHMMLNHREFFACSATTYLYGVTAQEPFYRSKVMKAQADFFSYLQMLFGPDTGKYVGALDK